MTRTILAALGLIALAACGGGSHKATHARASATSSQRAATEPRKATRTSRQKRKAGARRDTTTQRNPLTNR
jgi:hypothetical protein